MTGVPDRPEPLDCATPRRRQDSTYDILSSVLIVVVAFAVLFGDMAVVSFAFAGMRGAN